MHIPFVKEVKDRFKLPWKNLAFNIYFIFILIGFGALGIFVELIQIWQGAEKEGYTICQDLSAYALAIIAASLVDLNLSLKITSQPTLTILSLVIAGVSVLLMVLCYNINSYWALIPALISVLIALCVWVLAYADNENLSDAAFYDKMRGKNLGHGQNWE